MLTIKTVGLAEVQQMQDWAASEGWNPGLDDAALFHQSDPDGFIMAFDDAGPVAGISVISTGDRFGFLGLYICRPQYRGHGYGWAVWQAGMQHLDGRIVGLDGVVEQQANYRKSGFESAYRNIRYAGSTKKLLSSSTVGSRSGDDRTLCRPMTQSDRERVISLDAKVHGFRRERMLDSWLSTSETRFSLVCQIDGVVEGFGTIRQCLEGYKVGPLIAMSSKIAADLLVELVGRSAAQNVVLDVPEPNQTAIDLAEGFGFQPVFETARMFKGGRPDYWLGGLFGVTSFELG